MQLAAKIAVTMISAMSVLAGSARAEVAASAWDPETADGAFVCRMTTTRDVGGHGNRINGCPDSYAQWRQDGERLHVLDKRAFARAEIFCRAAAIS